jgi:hypothetical protein
MMSDHRGEVDSLFSKGGEPSKFIDDQDVNEDKEWNSKNLAEFKKVLAAVYDFILNLKGWCHIK